jgi:hypothetical protein
MRKKSAPILVCSALTIFAAAARADFIGVATLSPTQELDPLTMMPPGSTATGSFRMDYNPATNIINYSLTYSGLTSPTTMAHIHIGPPGLTGAPLLMLYDYGMPPSRSLTANTTTGTLSLNDFMPDSVDGIGTFGHSRRLRAVKRTSIYTA